MRYIVGRPVSGALFYGRKSLLDKIFHGPEWGTWLIGGRRIGKTSVLHQIRYNTLDSSDQVAIYCNWQPARNVEDLKHRLLFGLQDPDSQIFEKLKVSEEKIEKLSFFDALNYLVLQAHKQKTKIFLLIDEPEDVLLELDNTDLFALKQLRSCLIQSDYLHTVIVSSPLLRTLYDQEWKTSPFWEGFEPIFIGALEEDEAVKLIRQTQSTQPKKFPDELVRKILERTGRIPWLIQAVSQKAETSRELDRIWVSREYDDRFRTDYRMLSDNEQCVLRSVGKLHEPVGLGQILEGCNTSEGRVLQILQRLEQLGYIKIDGSGRYGISNCLLNEWLSLGLWKEVDQLKKHSKPIPTVSEAQESPSQQTAITTIRNRLKKHFDQTVVLEELCQDIGLDMSRIRQGTVANFINDILKEGQRLEKLSAIDHWINQRLDKLSDD